MKTYTVYKITNLMTGKAYIGASQNPLHRLTAHRSQNPHFFEGDGYQWEVLAKGLTKQEAGLCECEMVLAHQTVEPNGYNKRDGGYQGYKHRIESIKKMSENYARVRKKRSRPTEEQLTKLHAGRDASYAAGKHPWQGRTHTEESKAKISAANSGHKHWEGRKHTPEAIAKMVAARRARSTAKLGPMPQEQKDAIRAAKLASGKAHAAAAKGWETRRAKKAESDPVPNGV
ncbi:MAG: hypothetical protein EOO38_00065 [Cytophagaceae bacterium]|nr:MAG: hypothetical protein EOO38_00065 [Cytophagaceae bacterium]